MDFSRMSDAELEAMAGSAPNFSGMSDAALEAIVGGGAGALKGASAPVASPTLEPVFDLGIDQAAQAHGDKLLTRTIGKGIYSGILGLPGLAVDAATNAAYGGKKLASKTGLVEAPDPENYYGKDGGYLPVSTAISDAGDKGLDALGLDRPANERERIGAAIGEGVVGGATGAGVGSVIARGGSALAQRVGGFLAAQPGVQAAAGGAAGGAAQGVTELGGDPTAAMLAGLAAGSVTGVGAARAARPAAAPVPTTEALREAKTAAYARSEAAGASFTPQAVSALDNAIRGELPGRGIFLDTSPEARRVLDPLTRSAAPDAAGRRAPVSLTRMDDIRQQAGKLSRSTDQTERRTGGILAGRIDDFLDNVGPGQVAAGDPAAAITALREGQTANRRYAKASALDAALDKAELRAASTGTGQNVENAARQNLRRIIEDPQSRAFRQFDPPEREAMRSIVEGSRTQNALRFGSRFAPTGAVSGITGMFAASQGFGAVPLAGLAAKGAGDFLHGRKVRRLEDLVKGGPGAGRRPSARYGANGARGVAQGFLAGARADEPGRGRYR